MAIGEWWCSSTNAEIPSSLTHQWLEIVSHLLGYEDLVLLLLIITTSPECNDIISKAVISQQLGNLEVLIANNLKIQMHHGGGEEQCWRMSYY